MLFHLNKLEDAAAELRQAGALDAAYANALCNLRSTLHRLEQDGKAELMTEDWTEFIALATRLSRDTDARSALRDKLAAAHDIAPLFDTARSVRAHEFGFAEMWWRHCSGEETRPIDIPKGHGRAASLSRTPG